MFTLLINGIQLLPRAKIVKIIILSFLFFLLFIPPQSLAQKWSPPIKIDKLSCIQFQWRLVGYETSLRQNKIEWAFVNQSDSTIIFSYMIVGEPEEKVFGRAKLTPYKEKFLGWTFTGKKIVTVQIDDIEIINNRNEKSPFK